MKAISSTFSIGMLSEGAQLSFTPVTLSEARNFCKLAGGELSNYCNPRHESTAALVAMLTEIPCAGGFLAYEEGMRILVILPPRDMMSRSGEELNLTDLETCQFWIVS